MPIVKTILFCARHNIPLRGHREMGSVASDDVRDICLNGEQGVFRGLLSFRIECGDIDLLNHLETASKNCTMISPQIQNEVIKAIGSAIEKKIVERIKSSKFYSILCDETTDISTEEQMTVCIRYVDLTNCVIQEDFLGFVKMTSTTGASIKNAIKQKLQELGLSLDNLRGKGYDGGSNMAGKNNGVQALLLNEQPLAFYTHCFSHSLNLCISKACEVSSIKQMMGIIGAVASFFPASAKRADKLKSIIESEIPNTESNKQRKTKLKTLCEARWVERHDSLMTFKELYIFILNALEELQHDTNTETSSKALLYLISITKSEFLVAIDVAVLCLAYTLQLSVAL
uniref:Zinc finger MYM-type protein 1 n=1 Tax=Sipha flava TaxID=143950 RepID=A0A2S2R1F9_9HEMI